MIEVLSNCLTRMECLTVVAEAVKYAILIGLDGNDGRKHFK